MHLAGFKGSGKHFPVYVVKVMSNPHKNECPHDGDLLNTTEAARCMNILLRSEVPEAYGEMVKQSYGVSVDPGVLR